VREQLAKSRERANEMHFTQSHKEKIGSLRNGQTDSLGIDLDANVLYLIVCFSDLNCFGLNIGLYDSYGKEISLVKGEGGENNPGSYFSTALVSESGHYTLKVTMRDCRSSSCCYGIGVYSKPVDQALAEAGGATEGNAGDCQDASLQVVNKKLNDEADVPFRQHGISVITRLIGSLAEDEHKDYSVRLERGKKYALIAVSDDDCRDLGVAVLDNSGRDVSKMKENPGEGAYFAAVYPETTGLYTVRVTMRNCKSSHCCFGVEIGGK
jgi:hypothetical protein